MVVTDVVMKLLVPARNIDIIYDIRVSNEQQRHHMINCIKPWASCIVRVMPVCMSSKYVVRKSETNQ